MSHTKTKAAWVLDTPETAEENALLPVQFNPKSTATEAQQFRIVQALREGPKTSDYLRTILGCYQSSARVKELRSAGYDIVTERITLVDRDGYLHPRAARYHLMSEPNKGAQ